MIGVWFRRQARGAANASSLRGSKFCARRNGVWRCQSVILTPKFSVGAMDGSWELKVRRSAGSRLRPGPEAPTASGSGHGVQVVFGNSREGKLRDAYVFVAIGGRVPTDCNGRHHEVETGLTTQLHINLRSCRNIGSVFRYECEATTPEASASDSRCAAVSRLRGSPGAAIWPQ